MRHYRHSDAVRLIEEVESQGGQYLPETCMISEIDFEDGHKPAQSSGCEEDAVFLVSYDPDAHVKVNEPRLVPDTSPDAPKGRRKQARDKDGVLLYDVVEHEAPPRAPGEKLNTRGLALVCANDDLLRAWPRFQHVIQHPDPTERR